LAPRGAQTGLLAHGRGSVRVQKLQYGGWKAAAPPRMAALLSSFSLAGKNFYTEDAWIERVFP